MIPPTILTLLLAFLSLSHCATLSSADFTGTVTQSEYYVFSNVVGISIDLPELIPHLKSDLLQRYLLNSMLQGVWDYVFEQTIHTPPGYKYNCSLIASLTNITTNSSNCVFDMSDPTFVTDMGNYGWNTTNWFALALGWDQQDWLFTSNLTTTAFVPFFRDLYKAFKQPFNIELVDKGNLYGQNNIRQNFTASQFVQDCSTINSVIYGLSLQGPGTTESADATWYSINRDIYNYCGTFTLRAVIFPNPADLTLNNLLSENYTSQYIKRRMTVNGTSYLQDFVSYFGSINDIRLVENPMGVAGLTNSFAACIWAIEFAMEFFFASGFRIDFFTTFANGSYQGPFGPGPEFAPTGLYYAMMMMNLVVMDYPYVQQTIITSGTSSSIRVYGFDYYYTYGFLILNKDTNSTRTGEVKIKIKSLSGVFCTYLTAPNLTATSGFKLGNLQFIGNQSKPVGQYTEFKYIADDTGFYHIPLNYSQVVYCTTRDSFDYNPLPDATLADMNSSPTTQLILSLLLLLILLAL